MLSAKFDHKRSAAVLLDQEMGMADAAGKTAADYAAGGDGALAGLLAGEHRVRDQAGRTALMRAAARGDAVQAARLLWQKGEMDGRWRTALWYAAAEGHGRCVSLLASEAGICPERETALMHEARRGCVGSVRLLLREAGRRDQRGRTALMWAAEAGQAECLGALVELEGGMVDRAGRSALMAAAEMGHVECVALITRVNQI